MQPDTRPAEALRGENRRLREEVSRYQEREEHFASVLQVTDGGQYRADWDGAIRRVLRERDALREEVARLRTLLSDISLDASNGRYPTNDAEVE